MFWFFGAMLTNSHVMHLSINIQCFGEKRKDLLAHLQFRERIAECWINPDKYSNEMKQNEHKNNNFMQKRKRDSSLSSVSSVTVNDALLPNTKKPKVSAKHVMDRSLAPGGNSQCRLDRHLDHLLCKKESNRARCALHRWIGIETSSQLSNCATCGAHLCSQCYRLFHTEPNLVAMKEKLRKKYQK